MRNFNSKIFFLIAFFSIIYFVDLNDNKVDYDSIRTLHKQNLEKSPFKNTKKLSKSERKELQLPPNPYNERLWELTMDPVLGRPRTENLYQIQDELYQKSLYPVEGVPGENPDMAWVARGPSNVAGRTNGMMFDPNDETLAKDGIIFCSISEAIKEYPDLVKKYIGKVIPKTDNYYATLR